MADGDNRFCAASELLAATSKLINAAQLSGSILTRLRIMVSLSVRKHVFVCGSMYFWDRARSTDQAECVYGQMHKDNLK